MVASTESLCGFLSVLGWSHDKKVFASQIIFDGKLSIAILKTIAKCFECAHICLRTITTFNLCYVRGDCWYCSPIFHATDNLRELKLFFDINISSGFVVHTC